MAAQPLPPDARPAIGGFRGSTNPRRGPHRTTVTPGDHRDPRRRHLMRNSPNRIVATVFGAVYVLVGLLGFAVTGGVGFIATEGGLLLGIFQVNPLHNVAHILIGAALLIPGVATGAAPRAVNT